MSGNKESISMITKSKSLKPHAPTAEKPQVGQWISKQKNLLADSAAQKRPAAADPVPADAAAPSPKLVAKEHKAEKKKKEDVDSDDWLEDKKVESPERLCDFCREQVANQQLCFECKESYCVDCQNDHPESCLGDFVSSASTGEKPKWQCFGCLNKRTKPPPAKLARVDSLEDIERVCKEREKKIDAALLLPSLPERPQDPPKAATSVRRVDTYCVIFPELPEDVLVHKAVPPTNCQLPLCGFCVRHKTPTVFTVHTAMGIAVPCGHAIACKECAVEFCLTKKNLTCPVSACQQVVESVVLVQNTIHPPLPLK